MALVKLPRKPGVPGVPGGVQGRGRSGVRGVMSGTLFFSGDVEPKGPEEEDASDTLDLVGSNCSMISLPLLSDFDNFGIKISSFLLQIFAPALSKSSVLAGLVGASFVELDTLPDDAAMGF